MDFPYVEDLKPCPWCGSKDLIIDTEWIPEKGDVYFIECVDCSNPGIMRHKDLTTLVKNWNEFPRRSNL
jgi:Zn ribbon nucleic-acid-binding protein